MSDNLLTVAEAAAILRLHPKTINRMIRAGALTAQRVGVGRGVWRIRRADLATATAPKRGRPAKGGDT